MFVDMRKDINITSRFKNKNNVRCETFSFIQQNSMHVSKSAIFENFASNHEIDEQNSDSVENHIAIKFSFFKIDFDFV